MKQITNNISGINEKLIIVPIGDWHIGDANCNISEIRKEIEFVKSNPDAYCILLGDILNWASKVSISNVYDEKFTPMEEINRAVSLFKPIKHKILGVITGNHENRLYKSEGIDLMYIVCDQLGIVDKYAEFTALIWAKFGLQSSRAASGRKMIYRIMINHGSGGGRKEGGKINRLADLALIGDADVFISAHTHLPAAFRDQYYRSQNNFNTGHFVDRLFVNCASKLNYGGYAEMKAYKPASIKSPLIYLSATERQMEALI